MNYTTKVLILIFCFYAVIDLSIKITYTRKNMHIKKSTQRNRMFLK